MREAVPLDRRRFEERHSHLRLVGRVVKRRRQELALVVPLLKLNAKLETVDLLDGDEALNCPLVEASLLRARGISVLIIRCS